MVPCHFPLIQIISSALRSQRPEVCAVPLEGRAKFRIHKNLHTYLPKNAVFWDVAPCRSCVKRLFGGTSVHTRSTPRYILEKWHSSQSRLWKPQTLHTIIPILILGFWIRHGVIKYPAALNNKGGGGETDNSKYKSAHNNTNNNNNRNKDNLVQLFICLHAALTALWPGIK
jgi:hypothetical protein